MTHQKAPTMPDGSPLDPAALAILKERYPRYWTVLDLRKTMTQEQVASRLGVGRQRIAQIEQVALRMLWLHVRKDKEMRWPRGWSSG